MGPDIKETKRYPSETEQTNDYEDYIGYNGMIVPESFPETRKFIHRKSLLFYYIANLRFLRDIKHISLFQFLYTSATLVLNFIYKLLLQVISL